MSDLEKLESLWRIQSVTDSPNPERYQKAGQMLFIGPAGWCQPLMNQWHDDVGLRMDFVEDYYLVPWERIGLYRMVLFAVFPFIDEQTGKCIFPEMPGNLKLNGPQPVPLREDGRECCAGLISRLRESNPVLIIVVFNGGEREIEHLYSDAGADYVFQTGCYLFDNNNLPRFLQGLLAS